MVGNTNTEGNALGSSLGIIKRSGDKIFNKIYKMEIPQSSNAIGSSFESLTSSSKGIFKTISSAPKILTISLNSLSSSGKQLLQRIPKIPQNNQAMG